MSVKLFTDKLVFRQLEVPRGWSLDSATPSESAYPGGGRQNGFENAMRHCVAACMVTQKCGEDCATKLGFAVEAHPKNVINGRDMENDLNNDFVGIRLGRHYPNSDCHSLCGQAWKEKKLWW